MKYNYVLFFIGFMLLSPYAWGQSSWKIAGKSLVELRKTSVLPVENAPGLQRISEAKVHQVQHPPRDITKVEVPKAYSFDHLGVFCKWEVKMERAAGIPVKFRLGEVQYVERMEGKYE